MVQAPDQAAVAVLLPHRKPKLNRMPMVQAARIAVDVLLALLATGAACWTHCSDQSNPTGRIVGETNAHARDLINKREQEVVEVRMMDVLQQVQEPSTHGTLGKLCA